MRHSSDAYSIFPNLNYRPLLYILFVVALIAPLLSVANSTGHLATSSAQATSPKVHLNILIVDDGSTMIAAFRDRLRAEGLRTTEILSSDPLRAKITPEFLRGAAGTNTAKFSGVVLPSATPNGISTEEMATLGDFESEYGVREVDLYNWANPTLGLTWADYSGPVDGMETALTAPALDGPWSYLSGSLTLDDFDASVPESYGYIARPLADDPNGEFTPFLTSQVPNAPEPGSLIGEYRVGERERLIVTFASNGYQQHFKVLSHGMISWLTKGVSTSLYRNWLAVHVDDVFLADASWSAEGNCTIGDGCDPATYPDTAPGATSRMNPADVDFLADWQTVNGLKLDMAYNASGTEEFGPFDPLTSAFLSRHEDFRWLNHTFEHPYMGCIQNFATAPWSCQVDQSGATEWYPRIGISEQIGNNVGWATANQVSVNQSELVTGEHSGIRTLPQMLIDNPNLAPALGDNGVQWIATDSSREFEQRALGAAQTVPRYPMNIFYNVSTKQELIDEYNWIYNSAADGGSGICTVNPASTCIAPLDPITGFDDYIVPLESRIAIGHVLQVDPRPHYAHQSNLTNDRVLYTVLDEVESIYSGLFRSNTPLINSAMSENGLELQRRRHWAQSNGIEAYVSGSTLTIVNSSATAVEVPVTVPESSTFLGNPFGESYAQARSQWTAVPAFSTLELSLSGGPVFSNNQPEPTTTAVPTTTAAPTTTTDGSTEALERLAAIIEWIRAAAIARAGSTGN